MFGCRLQLDIDIDNSSNCFHDTDSATRIHARPTGEMDSANTMYVHTRPSLRVRELMLTFAIRAMLEKQLADMHSALERFSGPSASSNSSQTLRARREERMKRQQEKNWKRSDDMRKRVQEQSQKEKDATDRHKKSAGGVQEQYIKQEPQESDDDDLDRNEEARAVMPYSPAQNITGVLQSIEQDEAIVVDSDDSESNVSNRAMVPYHSAPVNPPAPRARHLLQQHAHEATPSAPPPRRPSSDTMGYLATKSREIQRYKSVDNGLQNSLGGVLETTGIIIGSSSCVQVTHMLIDPSATASFISSAAARAARLDIHRSDTAEQFLCAGGTMALHNDYTLPTLSIEGVSQQIQAYIDNSPGTSHHLLIGGTDFARFNIRTNHSVGGAGETRWSISQNLTGARRIRYVLRPDDPNEPARLTPYGHAEGMRLAQQVGETATQRKSREILERGGLKHEQLKARHQAKAGPYYKG